MTTRGYSKVPMWPTTEVTFKRLSGGYYITPVMTHGRAEGLEMGPAIKEVLNEPKV